MLEIQVWDFFWLFMFVILVSDPGLGSIVWMQVWDSGLGFRFGIQVWDSGLDSDLIKILIWDSV